MTSRGLFCHGSNTNKLYQLTLCVPPHQDNPSDYSGQSSQDPTELWPSLKAGSQPPHCSLNLNGNIS